jgi:small subunit ribosomal protein S9
MEPFVATQSCGAFDIYATVAGGGSSGQAGALRHGIARALARFDPQLKPLLRQCESMRDEEGATH